MRFRSRAMACAVVAVTCLSVPLAPAVVAEPGDVSEPIVEELAGPVGLAVARNGSVYVSEGFAGVLTEVRPNGRTRVVATSGGPESSIFGVARGPRGSVLFTESGGEAPDFVGLVRQLKANGRIVTLADTAAHEIGRNPDAGNSYGFQDLSPACADEVDDVGLEFVTGRPFEGEVNANAYAVVAMPNGSTVVADAGGNSIVRVTSDGRVRTLAVLPPVPQVITADAAAGLGAPDCVVGSTYNFDPVPTDVELGNDGMLYISSLGGGPEDGSLSTGGVFRLNPRTKRLTRIGEGFSGATDLAVTRFGRIFVTELYANRVSELVEGGPEPLVELTEPAAIEVARGRLWVTTGVFSGGAVVTVEF